MSVTVSVILYDENGYHAAATRDPSTEIVSSLKNLIESLNSKADICLAVGICSLNKSRIIGDIVNLRQVTSIWLCGDYEHGGHEQDPLHHPKVKDMILFNLGENGLRNLDIKGHMDNRKQCLFHDKSEQYTVETKKY
ncbi:unnamed protein product [Rotaria magnacalcarata]|uniref:Uncharacterized protein n=1 Tax=Rotaria magnacalcarata TaxID=392030 RepID=A0A816LWI5_9BILA|nr:unnamed protein product [Rotaria magnacalcarata]CAF2070657.1 unnamed protein product [Rotaria magnacalcarata]CAF4101782.1 unnamed protein product [Rotaria magnacalcarata]CAF4208134.1 unnamed protein product [Rotaria magnacalcarata]